MAKKPVAWSQRPIADTEPRVQRLSDGPYSERGMGPQGLKLARGFVLGKRKADTAIIRLSDLRYEKIITSLCSFLALSP